MLAPVISSLDEIYCNSFNQSFIHSQMTFIHKRRSFKEDASLAYLALFFPARKFSSLLFSGLSNFSIMHHRLFGFFILPFLFLSFPFFPCSLCLHHPGKKPCIIIAPPPPTEVALVLIVAVKGGKEKEGERQVEEEKERKWQWCY